MPAHARHAELDELLGGGDVGSNSTDSSARSSGPVSADSSSSSPVSVSSPDSGSDGGSRSGDRAPDGGASRDVRRKGGGGCRTRRQSFRLALGTGFAVAVGVFVVYIVGSQLFGTWLVYANFGDRLDFSVVLARATTGAVAVGLAASFTTFGLSRSVARRARLRVERVSTNGTAPGYELGSVRDVSELLVSKRG